mmetsp:Transcript_329/g.1138  ORF Transcript_329/g.1138 Transcript_329/m.1138 type:complete len:211 (-) Transcript_329:531-1163(-)
MERRVERAASAKARLLSICAEKPSGLPMLRRWVTSGIMPLISASCWNIICWSDFAMCRSILIADLLTQVLLIGGGMSNQALDVSTNCNEVDALRDFEGRLRRAWLCMSSTSNCEAQNAANETYEPLCHSHAASCHGRPIFLSGLNAAPTPALSLFMLHPAEMVRRSLKKDCGFCTRSEDGITTSALDVRPKTNRIPASNSEQAAFSSMVV